MGASSSSAAAADDSARDAATLVLPLMRSAADVAEVAMEELLGRLVLRRDVVALLDRRRSLV